MSDETRCPKCGGPTVVLDRVFSLVTGHLNVTEETVAVVPLPERSEP
jgi:exosome complex RNA-binding protein Rrp4